ncbi:hypothetical protein [Streptomyces sp. DH-12]|uniref:hypothetical protein n=1 Tax=Streptomyces sp. DH-12 TaxID=2072509 RepID=UPI001056FB3D|nr:hypothetical protein [Streptomyces sp. DH-12]
MTPSLRTLGTTLVLAAGAVLTPYGPLAGPPTAGTASGAERTITGTASGAERTPPGADSAGSAQARAVPRSPSASPSSSVSPSPSVSRTGGGPGEGRDRPGRRETAGEGSRDTAPSRRGAEEGTGPRGAAGRPDGDGARRPDARLDASAPAEVRDGAAEESPAGDAGGAAPSAPASSAAAPVPAASSPAAEPDAVAGTAAEPVLRILPLGSGLVLIGLGCALAHLGLRLRQERGAR